MEINIVPPNQDLPLERAYVVNMLIRSFKGRKDVEVHLHRPYWDDAEEKQYDWAAIFGNPPEKLGMEERNSIKVIMEAFNLEERTALIEYLKNRYAEKLKAINSAPLPFPIPQGLVPLSEMPEDENLGRIRLEKVPNYTLSFPVHGFYDLSAHPPILQNEQE